MAGQDGRVRTLEIEGGELALRLVKHFAVAQLFVEGEIIHRLDTLHVHCQPFNAVGQFGRNRITIESADLLEIRELRNLHAIAPYFPAQTPSSERWTLPIVFDEANIVLKRIDSDRANAVEIDFLHVFRRRLQDYLKLVVVLEP